MVAVQQTETEAGKHHSLLVKGMVTVCVAEDMVVG